VTRAKSDAAIGSSLVLAVFLWGANNAGTKFIVGTWPPVFTGATRFLCAGLLMLAIFRWTNWLGKPAQLSAPLKRELWLRGGLSLAVYIVAFNWALRLTSASHVALYLGASPVWALLWEGRPQKNWRTFQRYLAAAIALAGVFVLFLPALKNSRGGTIIGEVLGLLVSVLWTNYGRQSRVLGAKISGAEASAHTMWRAGLLLLPLGLAEAFRTGLQWRNDLVLIQLYCIVAGGVAAFAIWNNALAHWPASRVLLFNNLIPLSTTTWSHFCLGEPMTPTFWTAMILIVIGVGLGQTNWQKFLPAAVLPPE
jgi:drug/metabolite transporter (DMT)-like permease